VDGIFPGGCLAFRHVAILHYLKSFGPITHKVEDLIESESLPSLGVDSRDLLQGSQN
jgi:hypothetical protein